MATPRSYLLYLEDIQESMEKIFRYCTAMSFEQFCVNDLVIDAVVRNIEVIGEAAKKVPASVQQQYPQIPWSQMYRMRNRISHEYFGLDYAIVWRVATQHLPSNYEDILKILITEKGKNT